MERSDEKRLYLCCKTMDNKLYLQYVEEKLGNYLIDVSKYFLTGVFVASLVKDLEEIRWLIYVLSGSVAAVLLLLGLILTNKKEDK